MKEPIIVDRQLACAPSSSLPSQQQLTRWASAAISRFRHSAELTIRIVDEAESQSLNQQYRGKDYPTNVLSFPFEAPAEIELDLLGDLVICQAVVVNEAQQQQKTIEAHWAHMVVHGCLHLLGFDHQDAQQAAIMEPLECEILQQLGFNNPYLL